MIAGLQTIFTGPGSTVGQAGSGVRSKAAKHNMTSLTLASLAHVATPVSRFYRRLELELTAYTNLAVFVLHSPSTKWYRVADSQTDHWFDYDAFYAEVMTFLEDPGFKDDAADLLAFLNQRIYQQWRL
ncbi:hypothetical protein BDV93DRAFT_564782 [Ceratobasidium sp. AG-I]|nr:hypothetical protein BDV93DRAFT_564782 [Ceratobasidium sp. AG-I]